LIPQLTSSPPDVEAMRIYLILPEFPPFQDSKYYITLTLPLAMAILRLDTNPSKVLGKRLAFKMHVALRAQLGHKVLPSGFSVRFLC